VYVQVANDVSASVKCAVEGGIGVAYWFEIAGACEVYIIYKDIVAIKIISDILKIFNGGYGRGGVYP
jgi:hypothetical protein